LKYGTLQLKKIFANEKWEEITLNSYEIENNIKTNNEKYYKVNNTSIVNDNCIAYILNILLILTIIINNNNNNNNNN